AGTYWFVLPQEITDHNRVRIYNSDRTVFYGTVITINAERPRALVAREAQGVQHIAVEPVGLFPEAPKIRVLRFFTDHWRE
ncbi:MAG: hypothetical protein WA603_17210, partial [Candidatus Acidiferrales bacterium]